MKKQIVIIHGGDTFKTQKEYISYLKKMRIDFGRFVAGKKKGSWKTDLSRLLGKDFEVILPLMPNALDARYNEWKIMFDKFLPFLRNNLILAGLSLGGTFLAKYLSENKFPRKIAATILLATPYDDNNRKSAYTLNDFALPKRLTKFEKQGGQIFLYHSKDDPMVPLIDAIKYKHALPSAKIVLFENGGHFNQASFPELAHHIKKIMK